MIENPWYKDKFREMDLRIQQLSQGNQEYQKLTEKLEALNKKLQEKIKEL